MTWQPVLIRLLRVVLEVCHVLKPVDIKLQYINYQETREQQLLLWICVHIGLLEGRLV